MTAPFPKVAPDKLRHVLLVEECLRDERGHYAGFVCGLAAQLAARGVAVEIWGHREVAPRIAPPGVTLRPTFRESWIESLFRRSRWQRALSVFTHNASFLATLRRASRGRRWDCVIGTDVNVFHLFAWRAWLALAPRSTRLVLITIQPPWLFERDAHGAPNFKPQAWLYWVGWRLFRGAVRTGRCILAADTGANREAFARFCGVPFVEVPLPRADSLLTRLVAPPAAKAGLRLGILGRPTTEKGFDRMLTALELMMRDPERASGAMRFVLQWQDAPDSSADDLRRLRAAAAHAPERVEIVEGILSEERYAELLSSLHGVILPYSRAAYAGRGSSLLMDLLCAGRPIICTSRTWISDRVREWGAGLECDESPESIAAAIDEFTARYDELAALARERASVARELVSWERLLRVLGLIDSPASRHAPGSRRWELPDWVRRRPSLHAFFLQHQLTTPGRLLASHCAASGWRAQITGAAIRVTRENRELVCRLDDCFHLLRVDFDYLAARSFSELIGGKEVSDMRSPAWYRVSLSERRVRLRSMRDVEPVVEGYLAHRRPHAGETVFDVGAYAGEFTIVASECVGPAGRVIAFEPDPENRILLERNLAEYGLGNVTICPCALWKTSGRLEFNAFGDPGSAARIFIGGGEEMDVPALSWADAVAKFGTPNFVKMDIEGAEIEVIEAALPHLTAARPHFAIASYHVRDGCPTSERLESSFRRIGYEVVTGFPNHPTTWAWRAGPVDAAEGRPAVSLT